MSRIASALLLLVSACAGRPIALNYEPEHPFPDAPRAAAGKLVVLRPLDDRFAAERRSETMTQSAGFAVIGGMWGKFRGNQVTGDDTFSVSPGPFGAATMADTVGNVLVAALWRELAGVEADPAQIAWRCADGTCVPGAEQVRAVAAARGARFVLAIRLVHLYGMRYGEREMSVASYTQNRGYAVYQVTETTENRSYSQGYGNCILELTLFDVSGGVIARTVRHTVAAAKQGAAGTNLDVQPTLAGFANQAFSSALDGVRREVALVTAQPSTPQRRPGDPAR